MGLRAWVVLLLLATGCATTRVVHLDTGEGAPRLYTPAERAPVEVGEAEFKRAVTRLVLDLELSVADERRSLLASSAGLVDGARGRTVSPLHERLCARQSGSDSCLSLLGPMERRMMALSFALDTVWEGVGAALQELTDPTALRVMVTTVIGTALVMLVAPEPVTKFIAVALTASLIAYLGLGPVWDLGQGFMRLLDESRDARSLSELEDAGHRFGKVLGGNGARVLVIVALTALGGRNAMAAQGPRLPGAAQAALRAEAEGGFQLSAALSGEVRSIAIPAAGVLNITLAPTAVAAVAMGTGGGIQGTPTARSTTSAPTRMRSPKHRVAPGPLSFRRFASVPGWASMMQRTRCASGDIRVHILGSITRRYFAASTRPRWDAGEPHSAGQRWPTSCRRLRMSS